MTVTIQTDGEPVDLVVPFSPDEITFAQFCDFQQAEAIFAKCNEDRESNTVDEILATLAEALQVLCGSAVFSLAASASGVKLDKMVDQGYTLTIGDDIGLLELYAHIITVLRSANYSERYQPEKLPFYLDVQHKSKTYRVRAANAARVLTNKPLTVGEAIEVLEYRRRHKQQRDTKKVDGSALDFTLGLSEFAILVRGKNERLPADEQKREDWIVARRELLKDLPLTQVMRVRFFLIAALLKSSGGNSTAFGPMDHPPLMPLPKQRRKGKTVAAVRNLLGRRGT